MKRELIKHTIENGKYKIQIERAASSTKGIDGFKIEVNSDNLKEAKVQMIELYAYATRITKPTEVA